MDFYKKEFILSKHFLSKNLFGSSLSPEHSPYSKKCVDQTITLAQHGGDNFMAFSVFLFLKFVHLPFFFCKKL